MSGGNHPDQVASWRVSMPDGNHVVEFEHGTTSGKRVIVVDGKEIYRKDWMFKLVGKEYFEVGKAKCTISIDACSGFAYEYTLEVNGKPLQKFRENQGKIQKVWGVKVDDSNMVHRIVLEKGSLDIWLDGTKVESTGEFTDDGTETHFTVGVHSACITAVSSGKRRDGIIHSLFIDGHEAPEWKES